MQSFKKLTIIGTSHISIESIKTIKNFIKNEKPDIIALELDSSRLLSLVSKKQKKANPFKLGFKPYLINVVGAYIEKKLGKVVGVSPGSEMKIAIRLAKKNKLRIAVIDQDIAMTLKKLSKEITLKEKLRLVSEIITAPFKKRKLLIKKLNLKNSDLGKFDLRKVPSKEFINKIMKEVKKNYPNVYRILVEERNYVMAKNLKYLMHLYPNKKILAIVGAGHEQGIFKEIKSTKNISNQIN